MQRKKLFLSVGCLARCKDKVIYSRCDGEFKRDGRVSLRKSLARVRARWCKKVRGRI